MNSQAIIDEEDFSGFNKINKSYCLSSNTKYNILDLFIVKYEKDKQSKKLNVGLNRFKEMYAGQVV